MVTAVIGSRSFRDFNYMCTVLDELPIEHIVSGGATGADMLAIEYAKTRQLSWHVYRANWQQYGRSAGMRRNRDIVDAAELVVAFWDNTSAGTAHAINYARSTQTTVIVKTF